MEGNIWIESDGVGKGCTAIFDVKLGISNESKQSGIPKVPANPQHANFAGLKVLVMDENGLVLSLLVLIFLLFVIRFDVCFLVAG